MNVQDILDAYESIRLRTGAPPDEVEIEVETMSNGIVDSEPLNVASANGKLITLFREGFKP